MLPSSPKREPAKSRRDAALGFLAAHVDYERLHAVPYGGREFSLERIEQLLARLGNPHHRVPVVHIAGTKGKGSTAAMLSAVLTAAGYRTGLYTSPHLDRLEERIVIDGAPCSVSEFVGLVERVRPAVEAIEQAGQATDPPGIAPTHFDILTAMAMVFFAERKVDLAVLEVGLGGRLDSTNVCRPLVSVITSISFDHTQQLGHTLEAIAREKAGIIKPAVPVVSGVVESGPRQVIRQACQQAGCRLVERGVDFEFAYGPPRHLERAPDAGKLDFRYDCDGRKFGYCGLRLALVGSHQAANAALALAVLAELERQGWAVSAEAVRSALANVVFPARIELLARHPAVVLDGAHNVASVDALIRTLEESFSVPRRFLIFGASQDKEIRAMLDRLLGRFDQVIFTRCLENPRAMGPEDLAQVAAQVRPGPYRVCATPALAWDEARRLVQPEDLICITGSLFLAAEMRRQIQSRPVGTPVASVAPCD